jgi:hypothetical protein
MMKGPATIICIEDFARRHSATRAFAHHWRRHWHRGVRLDQREGWVVFDRGQWRPLKTAHELAVALGNVPRKDGVA